MYVCMYIRELCRNYVARTSHISRTTHLNNFGSPVEQLESVFLLPGQAYGVKSTANDMALGQHYLNKCAPWPQYAAQTSQHTDGQRSGCMPPITRSKRRLAETKRCLANVARFSSCSCSNSSVVQSGRVSGFLGSCCKYGNLKKCCMPSFRKYHLARSHKPKRLRASYSFGH